MSDGVERTDVPGPRLPDRRDFIGLGVGAFVVAALPWAARRRPELVRRSLPIMGTLADISVVHRDRAYAHRAIDAAFGELRRVDAGMSRFLPDSDVGRVNRRALREAVAVAPATAAVVAAGLRWAEASDGAFDPALGRSSALWEVTRHSAPPPEEESARYAARRLHRAVELDGDPEVPRVRLHDGDAALDLGGIGKGWAVDRAVDALRDHGVFNGFVNVGGDLFALGTSEDGDPWEVGVRSPFEPDRVIATFRLTDRAVATSGDYLRFFEYGGRRFHHLIDPATGKPRLSGVRSVTVAAPTCLAADAATTTVFGSPSAAARRLLAAAAPGAELLHRV